MCKENRKGGSLHSRHISLRLQNLLQNTPASKQCVNLKALGADRIGHTNQAPSCIGHVVEANAHGNFVSLRIPHDEVAAACGGTSQTSVQYRVGLGSAPSSNGYSVAAKALLPVHCRVDRKYEAEEVKDQSKDHYSKSLVVPRAIDV